MYNVWSLQQGSKVLEFGAWGVVKGTQNWSKLLRRGKTPSFYGYVFVYFLNNDLLSGPETIQH